MRLTRTSAISATRFRAPMEIEIVGMDERRSRLAPIALCFDFRIEGHIGKRSTDVVVALDVGPLREMAIAAVSLALGG